MMECRITRVSPVFTLSGGANGQMVNVTDGHCSATITTRYEAIGPTNIITLAHYPMTVVLYEFKNVYPYIRPSSVAWLSPTALRKAASSGWV